jgi:hypothetical protein
MTASFLPPFRYNVRESDFLTPLALTGNRKSVIGWSWLGKRILANEIPWLFFNSLGINSLKS